jgi:hypothetical protein
MQIGKIIVAPAQAGAYPACRQSTDLVKSDQAERKWQEAVAGEKSWVRF